jgi:RNA polymerase sigma-70 factor (ECF subfamily)
LVRRAQAAVREETDVALAARCSAGDRTAQRELFDRELYGVHATLYRTLGPCRDHDDLVQEAFLQVFRSIGGYRGEARLATWIARVTAHVAHRFLASKPPTAVWLEAIPEPASSDAPLPDGALARAAVRRTYELLAELEPTVHLAFALHVLDGRPLEEVARLMDASLVATKSRVWRARRRLRRDPSVRALLEPNVEDAADD